ncbi:transmembrane protein 53-like [Ptychodera flava]|uniref:transmembrane protein 53-like n=1 Tax=Ptychodera flava TaxID=63121 RepID=UPI00396AADD5
MATEGEEELEFHVTFPPALSPEDDGEEGERDGADLQQERAEPVVILLGWAGCQDRHLAKYSAIYQQQRFTTIRYSLPMEDTFFRPGKPKEMSLKIIELIFDLGLEDNVIIFHVFSNAGGFLYRGITEVVHDPNTVKQGTIKIGGVIFDSSPAHTSIINAVRALVNGMQANAVVRYAIAVFFVLTQWLSGIAGLVFPPLRQYGSGFQGYMYALENDKGRYPQMFLYSKADAVIPYSEVEKFAERRRVLGVPVRQMCWDDSAHCTLLVQHREEYINQCVQFVNDCLKT